MTNNLSGAVSYSASTQKLTIDTTDASLDATTSTAVFTVSLTDYPAILATYSVQIAFAATPAVDPVVPVDPVNPADAVLPVDPAVPLVDVVPEDSTQNDT